MATELVDGVWRFELRGGNAYLVETDVPTLVDAGTPWDAGALREGLDEAGSPSATSVACCSPTTTWTTSARWPRWRRTWTRRCTPPPPS